MDSKTLAYATAVLVNFVDQMGSSFLIPVIIPFGRVIGATDQEIAFFATIRGFFMLFSNVWLSMLSDCTSRRVAVLISISGSTVAYILQGAAAEVEEGVFLFTVGRGVAGFFAGTSPVLRAFVSDLYADNPKEMIQKMTVLQVASQGAGLAMAPIAGSVALLNLRLPFDIAAGAGVLGLIWAFFFFPKATDEKTAKPTQQGEATKEASSAPKEGSPYMDYVVMLMGFSFTTIAVMFSGVMFLLPTMLYEERFGIGGATPELKGGEVSRINGLLSLPNGLANLFVAIFVFAPLTNRIGTTRALLIAGVLASCVFPLYGQTSSIAQLAGLQVGLGLCFGIIFPSVGPLMARYSQVFFPQHKAQAQAVPMMGMSIGMMVGQNWASFLLSRLDYGTTYFVYGGNMLVSTLVMALVSFIITSKVQAETREDLSEEQRVIFAAEKGDDPEVFANKANGMVQDYLSQHMTELWNAPVQGLVLRRLLNSVPELAEWDEEKHGRAYMEDLYHAMEEYPDELQIHAELFPKDLRDATEHHVDRATIHALNGMEHMENVQHFPIRSKSAAVLERLPNSRSEVELQGKGSSSLLP